QGEGVIPADRQVTVAGAVVAHGFGKPALVLKPIVALFAQLTEAVAGEKCCIHAAPGGFPVHRLDAVLAELHRAGFWRIGPGASGGVEAAVLFGAQLGADVLQRIAAADPGAGHTAQRSPAAGSAGVRAKAGGSVETGGAAHIGHPFWRCDKWSHLA